MSSILFLAACGDDTGGDSDDGQGGQGADAGAGGSTAGTPGSGGSNDGGTDTGEGGEPGGGGSAGSGNAGNSGGASGGAGEGGTDGNGSCISADAEFEWPVPPESVDVPAHASWKNALTLPSDPFLSVPETYDPDGISWVKFTVLLSDPETVYFQNSNVYPFHYDFATERIPEFRGLSRQRFDALTLTSEERRAVLGAVLVPNNPIYSEYAVQLVLNDAVHPELVQTIVDSVKASVTAPENTDALYFPNPAQAACAAEHASYFASHDLPIGTVDRWLVGDACYAPGWAIGKIVELAAEDVDAAYLDGRLGASDILLLADSAPAELPYVAGVLTLEPSTPNSHTAILARSYAVPFAYLRSEDAKEDARALAGKEVVVSAQFDYAGDCSVRFIDVTDLDDSLRAEIRARAALPELEIQPKRTSGAFYLPTLGLTPGDIDRVGGKAANFGVLEAAIPSDIPAPALAFTFDLWDAFMGQPAPNGADGSLQDEITRRLEPYSWPPDLAELDGTLDQIRDLIRDAPFPRELTDEVLAALEPFDPDVRIRFRSSTNVEDSETFTGAGLYDSVTGCLADDLDDDTRGPSRCDPEEPSERGVLRAIRRVYSSFYARNAFFQRLARGVSEDDVGMAVLAHYSVPDTFELANGVATFTVFDAQSSHAELVTQVGAVSVTNPDGSATPETVLIERSGPSSFLRFAEGSSLLPLGDHVLTWDSEYKQLMSLLGRVADEYARTVEPEVPFTLDFEYKKIEPGELQVRQVRPLPQPDTTVDAVPVVVGEPTTLCVFPGETSDVFAMHRLKSRIALTARSGELTAARLGERLYEHARVEHLDRAENAVLVGDPSSFPQAAHTAEDGSVRDAWTAADARWTLTTALEPLVARNACPVVLPEDWTFTLSAEWDEPVPYLDFLEGPLTRTEDFVTLWASCPDTAELGAGSTRIERSFTGSNGLAVSTSYWYPPPPRGPTAGYTAPIVKWEETTIAGLTSQPIVLHGYYSQTHRPSHHNFGGDYIFDPRLEPGISQGLLAELIEADIAYLVVIDIDTSTEQTNFWLAGLDGTLRPL